MSGSGSHDVAVQEVQSSRSLYEVLGLNSGESDTARIKAAYHKRCLALHPDRTQTSDSEAAFKSVSKAYEILSDEKQKVLYDVVQDGTGCDTESLEKSGAVYALSRGLAAMLSASTRICVAPGCTQPVGSAAIANEVRYCEHCLEASAVAAKAARDHQELVASIALHSLASNNNNQSHEVPAESASMSSRAPSSSLPSTQPHHAMAYIHKAKPQCISAGCTADVQYRGLQCQKCMTAPVGKQGRCSNFGCLKPVVASGSVTSDSSDGQCESCKNKPKKCQTFGCFAMTKNPLGLCDRHLPPS